MWQGIRGHDDVVERFRRTIQRGRLASTYLFVGPAGVGKQRFALALARALLCETIEDAALEPCGTCESCRMTTAGNHPDLLTVGLPAGKSSLPISLFLGEKEKRHQQGLCHDISLRPFRGRKRVAVIDDADHFGIESANCLLKTLEEPPPDSLLILVGTTPSKQLPTIRSRSQEVRFDPLPTADVAHILVEAGIAADDARAVELATCSEGSVARAAALADAELWRFREQLLRELSAGEPNGVRLAHSVQEFVDAAGKEASLRRERLRILVSFAAEFYQAVLRASVGGQTDGDDLLNSAVCQVVNASPDPELAARALEHCLDALDAVNRNANLALVVHCWCDHLANIAHAGVA